MKSLALDSSNDLIIRDGNITTVSEASEVVQNVRSRLLFYFGEWFLNTSRGVPYFEEVFVKPANLAKIESIFKQTILETDGVLKLTNFAMEYIGESERLLKVYFGAETIYGTITPSEVTLNV